ncbi:MAG: SDR family oxidoreductase [Acidobacteriaceae bacterium]|nr:SDR family oxidoreductase [Acidobacteriaceae bacterium]
MIAVTGATGHLGRLAVEALLTRIPASEIVAIVRTPTKAADLAAKGVTVRTGDYNQPEPLASALSGVSKLLLVSSSEVGQRFAQHKATIDAAKAAGVTFIAYTSILNADTTPALLAEEHKATEEYLRSAGVDFALLRNGWYTENHTASLPASVAHGAVIGVAGDGRFATATRADYAEAAAVVLSTEGHNGKAYELAGDTSYNYTEFAAEAAKVSGKPVVYARLSEADYEAALTGFGLPAPLAHILADADAAAGKGMLDTTSRDLSQLIGRPTTPWQETVAATLKS